MGHTSRQQLLGRTWKEAGDQACTTYHRLLVVGKHEPCIPNTLMDSHVFVESRVGVRWNGLSTPVLRLETLLLSVGSITAHAAER